MPDANEPTVAPNALPPLPSSGDGSHGPDGVKTLRDIAADTCPLCGVTRRALRADTASPSPDFINGKYEILGVIGHGGFGVVYKVKNLGLNRIEALKVVLRQRFASDEVETRFRNEVIASARLQHVGIIVVYDTGLSNEGPFFTMEYEPKGTLKDLIERQFHKVPASDMPSTAYFPANSLLSTKPSPPPDAPVAPGVVPQAVSRSAPRSAKISWNEVARRMVLIAEAVEYMHRENVCHRDLKPSNILIGDADRPKLADFGLAALVAGRPDEQPAGTPNYMPPEQAAEWLDSWRKPSLQPAGGVDPPNRSDYYRRGDIYSLGAVFYEMLTGDPPVATQHRPEETLRAVRAGKILPPHQVNPNVPPKLEAICRKCLHLDPAQRFDGATPIVGELRAFLEPRSWTLFILRSVILLLCAVLVYAFVKPRVDLHRRVETLLVVAKQKEDAARTLETVRGNEIKDKERKNLLIEARTALYQMIQDSGSRDPEHHLQLARVTMNIGKVCNDLRDSQEAIRRFESAREQLADRSFVRPELKDPILADAYHWEAVTWQDEKKLTKAREQFEQSRELWKHLHEAAPENRDFRRYLARSHGYLGDLEAEIGLMRQADASYQEAADLREALVQEPNPTDTDRYQRARGLGNKGNFFEWEGRFAEALANYEHQVIELRQCPQPTPRAFQEDGPRVLVQIAELQLMIRPDLPPEKILAELDRADWDVGVGVKPRMLLTRGRCNILRHKHPEAIADLKQAIALYHRLIVEGKAQAQDYFRLSLAHLALSAVIGDPKRAEHHRVAAVLRLQEAVDRKFRQWRRVERDPLLSSRLREQTDFQEALRTMKAQRP